MNWKKPYEQFDKKSKSESIEVVSVDIFDTLLLRTTMPEFKKFLKFGEEISKLLPLQLISAANLKLYFMKLRILSARIVYHQKELTLGAREANLNEIYKVMLFALKCRFNLTDEQLLVIREILYQVEIECEATDLTLNQKLVETLEGARLYGKKVIAVSDMYLSFNDIELLLEKCGSDFRFDSIYVSSEFGYGKASGGLFDKVLIDYQVFPQQICHIGDNFRSDVAIPAEKGICAYYAPRSLFWKKTLQFRSYLNSKINSVA